MNSIPSTTLPTPTTKHPGFSKLKTQTGVYRCLLRPVKTKRDINHADYKGLLRLNNCTAQLLVWVHPNGTLGLRLEKLTPEQMEKIQTKTAPKRTPPNSAWPDIQE